MGGGGWVKERAGGKVWGEMNLGGGGGKKGRGVKGRGRGDEWGGGGSAPGEGSSTQPFIACMHGDQHTVLEQKQI